MSDIEDAFRCDECRTWHDDEDDARECCAPSITEGYKCKACGKYHHDAAPAKNCCVVSYACPECEEVFKTVEQAEDCCGCARLANTLRYRGHTISGDLTKIYRRNQ